VEYFIASANGVLYREKTEGVLTPLTTNLILSSTRQLTTAARGNKLFIADYGNVKAKYTDGILTVHDLLGEEKVVNGDFASAGTWTYGLGWSYDAVNKEADYFFPNAGKLSQNIGVVANKRYEITFQVKNSMTLWGIIPTCGGTTLIERRGNGIYTEQFVTSSTGELEFAVNAHGEDPLLSIDNVSVKEVLLGNELVTNGNFATAAVWTYGTGWYWNEGQACGTHGTDGAGTLWQSIVIEANKTYTLQYTVKALNAGKVTPTCGGAMLTQRSANGIYTEQFVTTSTEGLSFIPDVVTARFSIDDVSVKATLVPQGYLTSLSISNWLELGIDKNSDICSIYDGGTGAINGTYKISEITTGTLILTASAGTGNCSFCVDKAPKVYDYVADTLSIYEATAGKGSVPGSCPLVSLYRDRLVVSGSLVAPHAWFMSRQGDPYDWDYGQPDSDYARAVAGTLSQAGLVGKPIKAQVCYSDDCMIFGCTDELWLLRGDPAYGGQLLNLSRKIGIIDKKAWCCTPTGEIVFLSFDGLYIVQGCAMVTPQSLSREKLPEELLNVDVSLYTVSLEFSPEFRGIYIALTAIASGEKLGVYDLICSCDTLSGWTGLPTAVIDTIDKKEGIGSLSITGGTTGGAAYNYIFTPPEEVDLSKEKYISLWFKSNHIWSDFNWVILSLDSGSDHRSFDISGVQKFLADIWYRFDIDLNSYYINDPNFDLSKVDKIRFSVNAGAGIFHTLKFDLITYQSSQHWWFDWQTKTFWKDTYILSNHEPFYLFDYRANNVARRGVLFGCYDGYIRITKDANALDDGQEIDSCVVIGPIRLWDDYSIGSLVELIGTVAEGCKVDWELRVADTPEAVMSAAAFKTGTWTAGLNYKDRPRAKGGCFTLKIKKGTLADGETRAHWALERILAVIEQAGRQRKL
jgi:hypothetical protein